MIKAEPPDSTDFAGWMERYAEDYERVFAPLYRSALGRRGLTIADPQPAIFGLHFLSQFLGGSGARIVSLEERTVNPFLVTAKTFFDLAQSRKHQRHSYYTSRRGLIYDCLDDALAASASDRRGLRLRDYTSEQPRMLLRGQRRRIPPSSPLVRLLRTRPSGLNLRFPTPYLYISLLVSVSTFLFGPDGELNDALELVSIVPPTPFHLLLVDEATSQSALDEYAVYVTNIIRYQTLSALTDQERRTYLAHLTDLEMPVPVVNFMGVAQDYVPNPFVSTTANLGTALLYLSGYYSQFDDKFNIDWDKVIRLCLAEDNTGLLYVIAIKRWVLPVSAYAEAETVGATEDEYAVPHSIFDREIAQVIPIAVLGKRLGRSRLREIVTSRLDMNSPAGLELLNDIAIDTDLRGE